jgi:hypothetical protein
MMYKIVKYLTYVCTVVKLSRSFVCVIYLTDCGSMTETCNKLVVIKKYTLLLRSYYDGINLKKATFYVLTI